MSFLRLWWNKSYSYRWMVDYFEAHGALRAYRIGVGLSCWSYGLAAITTFITDDPPTSTFPQAVIVIGFVSAVVVGILWLRGPWPSQHVSLLFLVFADVGVTASLLSYGDIQSAFPGCALFAATGVYVQVYQSPRVLLAHLGWSILTVVTIFAVIMSDSTADHGLAWSQLVVLLPVMFATPVFLQSVLLSLRVDATGALMDHLTGLHNRRGLDEALPQFLGATSEVAVLVIDVDKFKSINDRSGHEDGDLALQLIARRLRIDGILAARTGGEEFAVIMCVSEPRALAAAEWIRNKLHVPSDPTPLTISIGLACESGIGPGVEVDMKTLLRRADVAMYEAKRRGGNQVVAAAREPLDQA